MDNDSASIVSVMASICSAQATLRDFAAQVRARAARDYLVKGRTSLNRSSLLGPRKSEWLIGERIELDDSRFLEMAIDMFFGPERLIISAAVFVTRETPEGFDEVEVMAHPARRLDSVADFIATLDEFVTAICANPNILEGIAVPR